MSRTRAKKWHLPEALHTKAQQARAQRLQAARKASKWRMPAAVVAALSLGGCASTPGEWCDAQPAACAVVVIGAATALALGATCLLHGHASSRRNDATQRPVAPPCNGCAL